MNRREFLRFSGCGLLTAMTGNLLACAGGPVNRNPQAAALLGDIQIIDAHCHPDWDCQCSPSERRAYTSTIAYMRELGMVASCFAAIGDQVHMRRGKLHGTEHNSTMTQLESWKREIDAGRIRLVRKASDIPQALGPDSPPGAILAIEGGDPLAGKIERLDEFYRYGVRLITLVHYRNNEIGDIMMADKDGAPAGPKNNGLTPAGRRIVERMQELGMVVDVAHADAATLAQVAAMTSRPLLDSHTQPCSVNDTGRCGRQRRWRDMELVVKTGGVICTWPQLNPASSRVSRATFADWAQEILLMKQRLGMAHVGLGTDGGWPSFPALRGYSDIRDLTALVTAMQAAGFSHEEIGAYLGGNVLRLLRACIG